MKCEGCVKVCIQILEPKMLPGNPTLQIRLSIAQNKQADGSHREPSETWNGNRTMGSESGAKPESGHTQQNGRHNDCGSIPDKVHRCVNHSADQTGTDDGQ